MMGKNDASRAREPSHPKERGQSLVEFAFGMVILLLLLGGIVDVGRALFTYMSMRDAAQEGASYAATHANLTLTQADVIERVCESSNFMLGLGCADADISPAPAGTDVLVKVSLDGMPCASEGGVVTVEITYHNFPLTMPLVSNQNVDIWTSVSDTVLRPFLCE